MILTGTVLKVEPVSGTNRDGERYSYTRATVFDGDEVYRCRVGNEYGSLPSSGEVIEAVVALRAYSNQGGQAGLSVTLLRPVAPAYAGARSAD